MNKQIVAIDGPSGAGKSTLAKMVAHALNFSYLDTGALYRASALGLVRAGIKEDAADEEISSVLDTLKLVFSGGTVELNGQDVSADIRTPEAGHYSSVFSARKSVRDFLMPVQQDAANHDDLVAEGRDMGTVVFPDAWRKIYLVATVEARALRRYRQFKDSDKPITMQEAERDVVERVERDSSRSLAPLKKAHDAFELDSSDMSLDETFSMIMQEVNKS